MSNSELAAQSGSPIAARSALPVGVVTTRDRDPLLLARARVQAPRRAPARCGCPIGTTEPGRDALGREEVGERARHRLDLRDLHVRPRVGATGAADERGQRTHRAEAPRVVVGVDRRRPGGIVAIGVVPEVQQPAGALSGRAVAPPVGPRAVRAHELARHHHDVRVDRDEVVEAEPEVVHRAGGVVLDDDVGVLGELHQHVVTLGRLRVRAEAELRAARRHERRRELAAGDGAHEVGVRARLDLDHLGAVLGEAAADLHTDRADAEVHDPHARERRGRIGRRCRRRRARRRGWRRPARCARRPPAVACADRRAVPSSSKNPVNTGAVTPSPTSSGANVSRDRRCTFVEHARRGQRGRAHDPASLCLGRGLVHAELREVLLEQRVDHRRRDHEPRHEALQLGVLEVLGIAQPLAERAPLPRAQHHQPHVAVRALEHG